MFDFLAANKITKILGLAFCLMFINSCDNSYTKDKNKVLKEQEQIQTYLNKGDFVAAIKKLEPLAKKDNFLAKDGLFKIYSNKNFVGFNPHLAYKIYLDNLKTLEKAIKKGNSDAPLLLKLYN